MTDPRALAHELEAGLDGEVRFDAGARAAYSRDASNYRQLPIGVVLPRHKEDVVTAVRLCHQAEVPVLSRGGGTSLAGQCTNVAVVMDFTKYMREVLEIDVTAKRARVLPGAVLDDLNGPAQARGLTFGPDPSTHDRCALGGMLGNNSCGPHSVMAGKTVDNVEELEILTYDGARFRVGRTSGEELERVIAAGGRRGEIYGTLRDLRDRHADRIRARYPDIPRRVSGYNLDELLPERGFDVARALVGTEGTCVVYLEATLRLVDWPRERALVVLGYPDVFTAAEDVPRIMEHDPLALEGLDGTLVGYMRRKGLREKGLDLLPAGSGWLMVEFGGDSRREANDRARQLAEALRTSGGAPNAALYRHEEDERTAWEIRAASLGATARIPGRRDTWPGWEDSAVHPESLGPYLRDFRALLDRYGYEAAMYGHFGQACVHTRIPFDIRTAAGLRDYRSFMDEATDLVLAYDGSLSGEHGDGQARGEWLPKMFGPELMDAFREFKRAWDPDGRMNPGKLVDARSMTDDLAEGTSYRPRDPSTRFAFPDDDGSFARAASRCVGVGKCRALEGGTMCPSYMATREETHSPRGRSRILFEMLNGAELDGWKDEHVRSALDLCLSCKGCKSDCPVSVDMATYKAEFLSHRYEGRLRPRHHYTFGLVYWAARAGSMVPRLTNFLTRSPGLARITKAIGGVARERDVPELAARPFRRRFRERQRRDRRGGVGLESRNAPAGPAAAGRRVLLFPDTFNNFFFPETLEAGVRVLEDAGCRVEIPPRILCCGRPLYHYGMLDLARRQLRQILDTLRPWIEAGVPMVGLEPSCVATFRDELHGMFPDDRDAARLRDLTYTLAGFLGRERLDWDPPALKGEALLWGHCQQRSVIGMEAEVELLERMGLDVARPNTGCCGMAGSFGFESDHYGLSIAVGEHGLLPEVRAAGDDVVLVADGFSCREQCIQTTGRQPRHMAELLGDLIERGRGRAARRPVGTRPVAGGP